MEEDPFNPIVIDNGSCYIKVGVAGEEKPRVVLHSVVGKTRNPSTEQNYYIGANAFDPHEPVSLSFPVSFGIVNDIDNMKKIWDYALFDQDQLQTEGRSVLMGIPRNPHDKLGKIAEVFFETYQVSSLCLANPAVLSFISTCRSTGIIWESGDGVSQIIPIHDMEPLKPIMTIEHFGGRNITSYMTTLLSMQGQHFMTPAEKELVREMKEKFGYVAMDYDAELKKAETTSECRKDFELPDGQVITLDKVRFMGPELIFQPNLGGIEEDGLDKNIYDAIMKCEITVRKEMYQNVIISGGNSCFKGLDERLQKEIARHAPPTIRVKVIAEKNRKHGTWVGGSIYASLPDFQSHCVSSEVYFDTGVNSLISHTVE